MVTRGREKPFDSHWIATITVASAFTFLCLDGYHNGFAIALNGSSDFFGEPPIINWTHGWPFHFAVRSSIYPASTGPGIPNPPSWTGDVGYYSRWPFDDAPMTVFHLLPLVVDAVIFILLIVGTWFGCSQLSSHFSFRFRFGLKTLFVATFLVAVAVAFKMTSLIPRYITQFGALSIIAIAMFVTTYGLVLVVRDRGDMVRSRVVAD